MANDSGFTVNVKMNSVNRILKRLGLENDGRVIKFIRDDSDRLMNPFIPMGDSGMLRRNKSYPSNHEIKYKSPYAHYQYYGKLMLAENGSSWAKLGEKKVVTSTNLKYHTSGTGPKWDQIMMQRKKSELIRDVKRFIKNLKKRRIKMSEKSKMDLIRDFIETCPLLKKGKVNVDYIKDKPQSYSIDETPSTTIIKEYRDGGTQNQILFDFSIQANFSVLENIKNSKFCEDFTNWIKEQDKKGNLPKIESICWIKCTGRGTILQTTDTTAIYVIPMQVVYEEDF